MSLNKPIWKLRDWIDIEKINYYYLSLNTHDKVLELLIENQDKINWNCLSINRNKNIITLFEKNKNKYNVLYSNDIIK